MNPKAKALVIDDEKAIRRLLKLVLSENGYQVYEAEAGGTGLTEAAQRKPDVILLDLGLPDLDGQTVLRRLREWSNAPVLILSVRNTTDEKVTALNHGADDYITKPFDVPELLARLKAIQRRVAETIDQSVLQAGPLTIDYESRTVKVNNKEISLSATEYELLRVLAQHQGKVVTHKQLLREIWGATAEDRSQYLRVYMAHLRKKLETPSGKRLIKTEIGIGYRMILP
ncbi:MAG TPA: DNA-binding response regulator [Desulfobulbaceae bacterium]|nr:DNA-binding response regulator [Desulfobulbaceae bacterium]